MFIRGTATITEERMSSDGVAAAEGGSVDLVFEGGGVKGIGLAGAFSLLEERGYRAQNVAGTSAGAITAALIAAGYTAAELREIVFGLDFRQFEDRHWYERAEHPCGKRHHRNSRQPLSEASAPHAGRERFRRPRRPAVHRCCSTDRWCRCRCCRPAVGRRGS